MALNTSQILSFHHFLILRQLYASTIHESPQTLVSLFHCRQVSLVLLSQVPRFQLLSCLLAQQGESHSSSCGKFVFRDPPQLLNRLSKVPWLLCRIIAQLLSRNPNIHHPLLPSRLDTEIFTPSPTHPLCYAYFPPLSKTPLHAASQSGVCYFAGSFS